MSLSNEEILDCRSAGMCNPAGSIYHGSIVEFARAVIAAHEAKRNGCERICPCGLRIDPTKTEEARFLMRTKQGVCRRKKWLAKVEKLMANYAAEVVNFWLNQSKERAEIVQQALDAAIAHISKPPTGMVKVKPLAWQESATETSFSVVVPQTRTSYFMVKSLWQDVWFLHVNGDSGAQCATSFDAKKRAEGDHESRIYALLEPK